MVFGLFLLLQFLWVTRSLLIVSALGVILGLSLSGGVDILVKRISMPRGIAAVLIVLLFFGALSGLGALLAPTLRDQARDLKEGLPKAMDRIEEWFAQNGLEIGSVLPKGEADEKAAPEAEPTQEGTEAAAGGEDEKATTDAGGTLRGRISSQLEGILGFLFPFVSGIFGALGAFVLMIFLAIFIAADPGLYKRGVMHLFPHRARRRADEVLTEIGTGLKRWLIARLISMVVVGLVVTGALMLLGVRSAIALGVLAGVLEFIPFFGPLIAAGPAIGLAFAESPEKALYVAIVFVLVNQLEASVLSPLLLQNRVDIPPALTLVAVAALGIVFGFLGLVIGEPLLVAVMVAIKLLYVEDVVGDDVMEEEAQGS